MRRGRLIFGAATAMLLTMAGSADAQKMVVPGRATSMAEQQRALREANAQAASARAQSRRLDGQAMEATAEADKLAAQSAALAARIQQSEAEIRAGETRIAIVNQQIADQSARLAARQGPLIRLAAALQSLSRRPPVFALLQPGSLRETVHVRAVFDQVLPAIRRKTAALRAEIARSRQLRAMAVNARKSLEEGKIRLATQRVDLQKLETRKRVSARGLASNATLEAERATAMGERARDIGDLMQELEAAGDVRQRLADLPGPEPRPAAPGEARAPRQESAAAAAGHAPAYRLPVVGALVTGMGELSESGVRARGVGIATAPGAQVVAPAQGRIAFAGPYRGFGQIVIIDHGEGWSTLITDLGRLTVEVGETVRQGEPVGTTAQRANPVVTVELRRQGRPVDIVAVASARP
ncbi:MAG: murein hydrolase activator EnvC [Sphingobium sp.]